MRRYLLPSVFLWCLVRAVRPQTYPFLTFRGETLPDHAYMDLSLVGANRDGSDSIQCHTNVETCCRGAQGPHRGDWFNPENRRLPFPAEGNLVFEDRQGQRVDLRQRNATTPTGVFRCAIDVSTVDGEPPVKKSVYVGLYLSDGGNVRMSDGMSLAVIFDLNGPSPQFTLTCNSTGGPATTVTWTRDSTTVAEGTETVLNNPLTAQYTHTLTVSGRPEGLYTCTVSNKKPSEDSVQLNIQASVEEFVVVNSLTSSLTFSWTLTPVSSLLVTGYNITCSPLMEGVPHPESLVREQQDTTASVTALYPGISYRCVIVTFSPRQTSLPQTVIDTTSEIAPSGSPEVFEADVDQRRVVFTWSAPPVTQRNGVITSYTLSCSPSPSSLPQSTSSQSESLTVTGFSPNTLYSCSVVATNSQGSGPPSTISFTTPEDYSSSQLHLREVPSGAVIGGTVAGVLVIIIAITIIIVSIVRVYHQRQSADAEEIMTTDLPDISTYSNVAYDMVKYRTESGEVGEDGTGGSSGDDTLQKCSHYATVYQTPDSRTRPTPQEHESPATRPPAPTVPGYINVRGVA